MINLKGTKKVERGDKSVKRSWEDVDWFPSGDGKLSERKEDLNSRLRMAVCYLSNSSKKKVQNWQVTDVCSQSCGIQRCGPHQEMIESSLALKWSLKKPWTIHQPFWQFEETTGWKKNQDVLSQKLLPHRCRLLHWHRFWF